MYREIVTPESQEITLKIPADYPHKKLVSIVFELVTRVLCKKIPD